MKKSKHEIKKKIFCKVYKIMFYVFLDRVDLDSYRQGNKLPKKDDSKLEKDPYLQI